MTKLLAIAILPLCIAFDIPDAACRHDVKIDDEHYNLSIIHDLGQATPTGAYYDVYGNLFFVQSIFETGGIRYDAFVIKNDSQTPTKIEGLPDGHSYSIAFDKTYDDVYFGTDKGIYIYDYEFSNASLDSNSKLQVNKIFIDKDGNKFITENNNGIELFFLEGDNKVPYNAIHALNEMVIDDDNNFYFINDEKLYQLKCDLLNPVYICNVDYNGMAQITFHNGKVFVASQDLLYFHENGINKLITVSIPGNLTMVAFDNNGDFTVGTKGKLLKYKKNACYFRE